jgi:hypothetical protein
MNLNRIKISWFPNCVSTLGRTVDALAVFNNIKEGRWREEVARIRHLYNETLKRTGSHEKAKKTVKHLKEALPGVTWCGRFARRANEALIEYSGLICADLDLLGERLAEVREKLKASPYLFALFLSPTADGLKAVFRVPRDASKHFGSFLALQKHVFELTGIQIDESDKDLARLCFVTDDPDAFLNLNAKEISPLPKLQVLNNQTAQQKKNVEQHLDKPSKEEIREMLRFIPKRPKYKPWFTIVAAVGDALPVHDAVEVLNEWSPEEEQGEYAAKLKSGFTEIHIATLIYLAMQHGWKGPENPYPSRNAEAARGFQEAIKNADAAQGENRDELTSLTSLGAADYPAPLEQAAFHGLAGDFVKRVLPHTEADPVALLIQFLIAYGNVIDRDAHAIADASRHGGNLFAVFTGKTSKSRKGTSWKHVLRLYAHVAPEWRRNCITTGLSSGEGLIWAVRDPTVKMENGETVVTDPGVKDKRLLVVEEEFSKPLVVADREGSTLSAVLRSAWDGDDVLRTMTKNSPARATGAHISTIGHITREELRSKLTEIASANGFGNRFLWPAVDRSKVLPEGGGSYGIADLVDGLQKAVAFAREVGELKRDEAARRLWVQVYPALSTGKPGLLGAITARAEAQVLRLSDLYALLDCSPVVRVEHLKAALAVWRYCEDSARWIFETKTGNWRADRILAALKVTGEKGKTKEQIRRDEFNGHITSFELDEALRLLFHSRLADRKEEDTGGRRAERWFFRPEIREKSEVREESQTNTSLNSQPLASENASSTNPDTEPVPDVGTVGPEVAASGSSLPVMITKEMEAQLKQRGFTQTDIDKLTPRQAQEILAASATPASGSDQEIAADIVIGEDPEGETLI